MSSTFEDQVKAAVATFSPIAEAVISAKAPFSTTEEFEPFHGLLLDDLRRFVDYTYDNFGEDAGLSKVDVTDPVVARAMCEIIANLAWGNPLEAVKANPANTSSTGTPPALAPSVNVTPRQETLPSVACPDPDKDGLSKYGGFASKVDPNTGSAHFEFPCGAKFEIYATAMAHKVLHHGYYNAKYSLGWARDIDKAMGGQGVVAQAAATEPEDPNPALVTVTNFWVPKMNLDLNDLGLAPGEISRFAAGEQADARFYWIRNLKVPTKIKGKFVWTKFAYRFNWEHLNTGDFIVRKVAGDTKEWVGCQKHAGVINPAFSRKWDSNLGKYVDNGLPQTIHHNKYVGEHEADIAEILNNPSQARVNYGLWKGECGYCGRNLTDAESRARGIGPDCYEAKYIPSLKRLAAQP